MNIQDTSIMKINELNCEGCPAIDLRTKDQLRKIKQWGRLKEKAIDSIDQIRLYILCESIPKDRFFYDLDTDYEKKGLRFNIKEELGLEFDQAVLNYFTRKGIVLTDCALCPLFLLDSNVEKRHAASFCLRNNTFSILTINPEVPIVTIFPTHRGYLKNDFPEIERRKVDEFLFNDLTGLKQVIEKYTK